MRNDLQDTALIQWIFCEAAGIELGTFLAWIIRDTRIIHPSGAVMAAPCAAKRG